MTMDCSAWNESCLSITIYFWTRLDSSSFEDFKTIKDTDLELEIPYEKTTPLWVLMG